MNPYAGTAIVFCFGIAFLIMAKSSPRKKALRDSRCHIDYECLKKAIEECPDDKVNTLIVQVDDFVEEFFGLVDNALVYSRDLYDRIRRKQLQANHT